MGVVTVSAAEQVVGPARIAEIGEGISQDELQLAGRNHGMPLEAMRYDVTPIGLHYLLIHYDIPDVDPTAWRLHVGGVVESPFTVDLDTIRAMPRTTRRVTIECAGNGRARLLPRPVSQPWLVEAVGNAEWTGTPLAPLLRRAAPTSAAREVVFTGSDHGVERGVEQTYQRSLSLADAYGDDVLLVYEMNGAPLPPQHGFPLRLLVPGWYGMAHVKWLTDITVIDSAFTGFQQEVAYQLRVDPHEPGVPVTRMEPRALLIPPGWPDFMTRARFLHPGPVSLRGRAWSGYAPITTIEVSSDGGRTWHLATVDSNAPRWDWCGWTWVWEARPGQHTLCVRATDASGRRQPTEQPWNRGGFANNTIQQVPVVVLEE
jgi:DMSO/TMAO reductase YedYZ molybdopterin-dependent catalytic subunit